jgi:CDP-diacylglycerol--glycerol-3-phosphate 3-phosphatidyltransferase
LGIADCGLKKWKAGQSRAGVSPAKSLEKMEMEKNHTQRPAPGIQSSALNPQSSVSAQPSALGAPHSTLRTPQSPIPNPQSAIRNPQSPIRPPLSFTSPKAKFFFVTALTLGRIPLILIFLVVNLVLMRHVAGAWVLGGPHSHAVWFAVAFGAMVLSALTDLFDGYFARKFNMVSKLGAYADPMTDKMFYLVAFPTLVFLAGLQRQMPHAALLLGLAVVFLIRDQWVSFLRSIGALHQVDARANWSGKARTLVSFPTICCIYWYLQAPTGWLDLAAWFIYTAEGLSLLINLISIWVYTRYYWPCIRRELRLPVREVSSRE